MGKIKLTIKRSEWKRKRLGDPNKPCDVTFLFNLNKEKITRCCMGFDLHYIYNVPDYGPVLYSHIGFPSMIKYSHLQKFFLVMLLNIC